MAALGLNQLAAQPEAGEPPMNPPAGDHPPMMLWERIPDLSEDQKEEIKTSVTEHKKDALPLHNQLREKQAHLETLSTADEADMTAINTTIDEIGELRTQLMKNRAAHRQEIRKLLTDDQRIHFDTMIVHKHHKADKKHRPKKGHAPRPCPKD